MIRLLLFLILLPLVSFCQEMVKGKILNASDVEGIHIFNKTLQKYTITNEKGAFEIVARVNDTLVFSALQYKLKTHVVYLEDFIRPIELQLEEKVNELDEVFIRSALSGNLLVDTKNIKTEQPAVTSESLKLPNAHVEKKVIEERRLYTATHGGGLLSVDMLINAISGKTKRLKKQLKLYKRSLLEDEVYSEFKDFIAFDFEIPEDKVYDFVFFAGNDPLFDSIVKTNNIEVILAFLKTKSKEYKKILSSK